MNSHQRRLKNRRHAQHLRRIAAQQEATRAWLKREGFASVTAWLNDQIGRNWKANREYALKMFYGTD